MPNNQQRPTLYSFRRCPYAMRARMSLVYSGIEVELREIILRDKPLSMLAYSPKGTVPVLVLRGNRSSAEVAGAEVSDAEDVVDESLDVMLWALAQHDPDDLLLAGDAELRADADRLIHENDTVFKKHLDQYKYSVRHPESPPEHYRAQGELFLHALEERLQESPYLLGNRMTLADIAIFPFIRQFANVDKAWFDQTPYPKLQAWLETFLNSPQFLTVMKKYVLWKDEDEGDKDKVVVFPPN